MKKILSIGLSLAMILCMGVCAFADDYGTAAPSTYSTQVTYTGSGIEGYTVTVPAKIVASTKNDVSGTVSIYGTWANNRMLTVTAPSTVTLKNTIDGTDKVLSVSFAGFHQRGSNVGYISESKSITVLQATNALFGSWAGIIDYTVAMSDVGA